MQTANLSVPPRIPFGTSITHHDLWRNFSTDRFRDQFRGLTGKEVMGLAVGTIVYIDTEHPNGKVYGWIKGEVTAVTVGSRHTLIGYRAGESRGTKRIEHDAQWTPFSVAVDEDALADILDELPEAKDIYG
jgi:hypothetical protein